MTDNRVRNSGISSKDACKSRFSLMGPAFISAIGYIDPGNFATNIQTGASYGYKLMWVVVWANLIAMLIQGLSAKLGVATRKNLAEQIRDHYPRTIVWLYWVQAEIIAIATDLAEFTGAAIGFKIVLNVSLFQGSLLTGVITFLILMLQKHGKKPVEWIISSLLLFVAVAYIIELIFSQPNIMQLGKGMLIPSLPTSEAVFLAASVLGATIMPHVIYLHSSLTQDFHGSSSQEKNSAIKWSIAVAMTIAGFVNLAMMAMAAAVFHFNGYTGISDLDQAYLTLEPLLSHTAATIFGLSLVAAGLSSTVVGTMAGQVVMQSFVKFNIPLWLRRSITMMPSFIVIFMGLNLARVLVISQVLLSFGIALALIPLLIFTSDTDLMGDLVNTNLVRRLGWLIIALVTTLNLWLIISILPNKIINF